MALENPSQVKFKNGTNTGTITTMDYMQKKPVVFNFMIEKKDCKHILFIKVSPQPIEHPVWGKPVVFNFMIEKKDCNHIFFIKVSSQLIEHPVWGKAECDWCFYPYCGE